MLRPVPAAAPPRPYTVSELLFEVGTSLRSHWRDIAVAGEIGRWEVRGGHGYFTLKDRTGCLSAIIFASDRERIPFRVEPGLEVVVRGSLDLWAPQGKFQLKAYDIEPIGAGALQLAFEQLKSRLAAEGLFDAARKRRIPLFPQAIGIVTSSEGAAIRDILNVIRRRHDGLAITVYPARVQGAGAAAEIAEGIRAFNRRGGFDVLIVTRGGGSPEDLAPFNDERVPEPSPPRASRRSRRSATRPTSRSPISRRTCGRRRPPPQRRSSSRRKRRCGSAPTGGGCASSGS
jgi:exodeoxyribonuclease VII large subunit